MSSIKPLSLIVGDIGGDFVEQTTLLGAGASPHHFSLSFSQFKSLHEADVLIWVGPQMEGFLSKALTNIDESQVLITAANLQAVVWPEQHEQSGHDHAVDMHLWLGEKNALLIAKQIRDELSSLLPDKAAYFNKRFNLFAQSLAKQRRQSSLRFDALSEKTFGVYHDGYAHFIADFGLQQLGHFTLVPDEQISVKRLIELKSQLKDASCLIAEKGESGKAQKYANKLSLSLVEVDLLASTLPSDDDFGTYMNSIATAFEACLTMPNSRD